MSISTPGVLSRVLFERAANFGVLPMADFPVQREAMHHEMRFWLELPKKIGSFKLYDARMILLDPRQLVDAIDNEIAATAALMRGSALREWIDASLPIDVLGDLGSESEHDRIERMGIRLAEISETLMKRLKGTR